MNSVESPFVAPELLRLPNRLGVSRDQTDALDIRKASSDQFHVVIPRRDPPPPPDFRREADRLMSLNSWPVTFIDKAIVARTGLYYYNDCDKVKCFACCLILAEWEQGDDPVADHERHRPNCPLLRGRPCNNIPLNASSASAPNSHPLSNNSSQPPDGQDVCGTLGQQTNGPMRPAFAAETARLTSFADWPCRMKQRPEDMADAGFFYTGTGDKCVCYYCGGGLKDWEDDDDPWTQHAQWFPKCHYIRLVKGDDFIQKINAELGDASKHELDNTKYKPESAKVPETTPTSVKSSASMQDCSSSSSTVSDSTLCKICFAAERNICFVPCGHVVACPKCALAVTVCPMCRQQFTSSMRLYYS